MRTQTLNLLRFGPASIFRYDSKSPYFMWTSNPSAAAAGTSPSRYAPRPLAMYRTTGKSLKNPHWVSLGNPTGDAFDSFNSHPSSVFKLTYWKTGRRGKKSYRYKSYAWVSMADGVVKTKANATRNQTHQLVSYVWLPMQQLPGKKDKADVHMAITQRLKWRASNPMLDEDDEEW